MNPLETAIKGAAEDARAPWFGVACVHLDGTPRVSLQAGSSVHAASTMKVPVLVELFRRASLGDLALDDRIVVRNAFRSLVDGSPYQLDPADDSEPSLYGREGDEVSLLDLAWPMITHSSNLATNLLVERLGAEAITTTMRDIGCPDLVVRRGLEDDRAYAAGISNTVTAAGLARLLAAIARRDVVSAEASTQMEAILAAQAFNEGIPAGLPAGTYVAHKTGSILALYHDAAIVRPAASSPYVLVVLTRGLDEDRAGPALAASIAGIVHGWDGP